jgi:hypothetical protein
MTKADMRRCYSITSSAMESSLDGTLIPSRSRRLQVNGEPECSALPCVRSNDPAFKVPTNCMVRREQAGRLYRHVRAGMLTPITISARHFRELGFSLYRHREDVYS